MQMSLKRQSIHKLLKNLFFLNCHQVVLIIISKANIYLCNLKNKCGSKFFNLKIINFEAYLFFELFYHGKLFSLCFQ